MNILDPALRNALRPHKLTGMLETHLCLIPAAGRRPRVR
jgi:hypothetical protein